MPRSEKIIRDDAEVIDMVTVAVLRMTPDERFRSVVAAGVLTAEGKLTEPYKTEPAATATPQAVRRDRVE